MTDPVLFQATTTYAAAHLDMLHRRQNQTRTLFRMVQTLSMINEQPQCDETALSNPNIGAVAMLASLEVSLGFF